MQRRGEHWYCASLPAAILARMFGIHIAVAWQRAPVGDWMTYAADIARRPSKETS